MKQPRTFKNVGSDIYLRYQIYRCSACGCEFTNFMYRRKKPEEIHSCDEPKHTGNHLIRGSL